MSATLRKATLDDIPLLIAAIRSADTAGDGERPTTYERMFDLSPTELDAMLASILAKRSSGHQLALESHFVLEDGGAVATCAAWVEQTGNATSAFQTASQLAAAVGMKKWLGAKHWIRCLSAVSLPRSASALQLENVYVLPERRGENASQRLISLVRDRFVAEQPGLASIEMSLLSTNTRALTAYTRAGFVVETVSEASDSRFVELTGSTGFTKVRLDLTASAAAADAS